METQDEQAAPPSAPCELVNGKSAVDGEIDDIEMLTADADMPHHIYLDD